LNVKSGKARGLGTGGGSGIGEAGVVGRSARLQDAGSGLHHHQTALTRSFNIDECINGCRRAVYFPGEVATLP